VSEREGDATPLVEIERQLERASTYAYTALGRAALRIQELERILYGLLDVLLSKGVVSPEEVAEASKKVQDELVARGNVPERLVALRVDPPGPQEAKEVNCAARVHVCKAVCCKLDFALSAQEVERGRVKWDLGRPYCIRHSERGVCHHNDQATGACGIHADRPGVCRTYSCAGDKRIWNDFERMELNHEWIEQNLSSPTPPRLLRLLMQPG
jgi:Fe-S-cluster containining protein